MLVVWREWYRGQWNLGSWRSKKRPVVSAFVGHRGQDTNTSSCSYLDLFRFLIIVGFSLQFFLFFYTRRSPNLGPLLFTFCLSNVAAKHENTNYVYLLLFSSS